MELNLTIKRKVEFCLHICLIVAIHYFILSHAGVSRSVAVMTAFLMKTDQLTFEKAYENLQTMKPEAK